MRTNDETTAALEMLIGFAEGVGNSDTLMDALGAVRLVEIAADAARRAIIAEARTNDLRGYPPHYVPRPASSWQEIGDALGTTRQNAWQRFGVSASQ